MVRWVFGFSVLIIVIALFVSYYVVAIIRAEEKLKYQAFFDPATDLPNQYRLREDLSAAFTQQRAGTVMMIVADREQEIFESFGAVETERWLIKVASRLYDGINAEEEKLYRFGGNAFVLVCWAGDLAGAQRRAEQLLSTARQPLHLERRELFSTLSIGASLMESGTGLDAANMAETLVQQIASACNRVRRAGGNDFAVYDEAMGLAAAKALRLAADLQHAVEKGELRLQYQPKVDTASGRLLGMEALVRWVHPERGMISPMEFIPVAEDTGLIVAIGRWVLREACRQNAAWQQAGLRPLRVAVNLSARQFSSGNLLDEIDAALSDTGLAVDSLELEITESMVMEDPEGVIKLLGTIHDRGIHIALDDFGTGHSSLAYLKRFPIDCVKIDRAFIKDTPENTDDVAIARTIVAMAKSLGLATVAEGVETVEQLELLKNMGCDQIQGYFFSRPLSADDFMAFYRAHL
jgi:EAL domain-containing protein (putative c-di-GMP-specific phosphodiesterase class I)/GGDEF domain-containing protein